MYNLTNKKINKLCYEGRLSLYCFICTKLFVLIFCIPQIYYDWPNVFGSKFIGAIFIFVLINAIIRCTLQNDNYQIAIRASFLGFVQGAGVLSVIFAPAVWKQFGFYAIFMAFFHFSEYLAIAWSNPASLTTDSFVLNHSIQYGIAAATSWAEFILEIYFLPEFKTKYYIWLIGLLLCILGESIRKIAILTASSSFTHLVRYEKEEHHKLVTHGIYGYVRHPSYVGWFWWSIGTQIILCNPICTFIYTIVVWKFFHDRIYVEEIALLNFFRLEYFTYQQKVPTGLPFIKGYSHQ